jgi:phage terminase large subunit
LIKLIDKYKPLFSCGEDIRYYVITGGRGSAKSFSVNTFTTGLSFEAGHRILFTRYTMTSAHLSIIPEFIEKISLLESRDKFKINKSEITNLYSGSDIVFKGIKTSSGDQTASLKSLQGVTTWILDEAEELTDESTFDKIDLSIRQEGKHNRVIIILNPTTKEHWIYKRFFESAGVEEGFNGVKGNVCYIHTTYQDNINNLNKSFINSVEKMKVQNPKKYNHIILGGWLDKAEGVVFENWNFGTFNPDGLQTSFGLDFGFSVDPDALTEVAIDKAKKKIYLKEHIYENGLQTHVLATKLKRCAGDKLIIADSAEPRLISDLKHKGINIKPVSKGKIESRVVMMQDFELVVEPNSTNIAKELNNYIYSDKRSNLYVDDYNHALDGIGYNIVYHLDNPNKGNYSLK